MKHFAFALLLFTTVSFAQETKPTLVQPGKLIAEPDLKSPLPAEWAVQKGTWDVKDGEIAVIDIPEQHHGPVLWHKVSLASGIVECEIKFDGANSFILGCDGAKHIGRLTINPKVMRLQEDSSEKKGVQPGATLSQAPVDLKRGEWYKVRYEWTGDKMAATLTGKTIEGTHPTLSQKRSRWWFATGGSKLEIRNIKVWEGK
ncbi:MAG: hypothetical protein JWO08_1085 [Verrucomicrobiaceae bacterium]|nr:hypothetical protein [Verrucomicrobiaceae bacterium]